MKKLITLFTLSILFINYGSSQERVPVDLANGQFYISILSPGIGYEFKIADKISLHSSITLGVLADTDIGNTDEDYLSLNPLLNFSLRNYYSRKKVKKQLKNNSGNYIGLRTIYTFDSVYDNQDGIYTHEGESSFIVGPVWGMQRNYQSGIYLGLELGAGLTDGKNRDLGFTPMVDFVFGFTIGGRKAKMPEYWGGI